MNMSTRAAVVAEPRRMRWRGDPRRAEGAEGQGPDADPDTSVAS